MTVLAWGLRQAELRFVELHTRAYERSSQIRSKMTTAPGTDDLVDPDPGQMYELGYAEGQSAAFREAADTFKTAVDVAKRP